jgi:predicted glycosyl hydrolase (DUF1957 family)
MTCTSEKTARLSKAVPQRFIRLSDALCANHVNEQWLEEIEARDKDLPDVGPSVYR